VPSKETTVMEYKQTVRKRSTSSSEDLLEKKVKKFKQNERFTHDEIFVAVTGSHMVIRWRVPVDISTNITWHAWMPPFLGKFRWSNVRGPKQGSFLGVTYSICFLETGRIIGTFTTELPDFPTDLLHFEGRWLKSGEVEWKSLSGTLGNVDYLSREYLPKYNIQNDTLNWMGTTLTKYGQPILVG